MTYAFFGLFDVPVPGQRTPGANNSQYPGAFSNRESVGRETRPDPISSEGPSRPDIDRVVGEGLANQGNRACA
jgi:hypothetical protein